MGPTAPSRRIEISSAKLWAATQLSTECVCTYRHTVRAPLPLALPSDTYLQAVCTFTGALCTNDGPPPPPSLRFCEDTRPVCNFTGVDCNNEQSRRSIALSVGYEQTAMSDALLSVVHGRPVWFFTLGEAGGCV